MQLKTENATPKHRRSLRGRFLPLASCLLPLASCLFLPSLLTQATEINPPPPCPPNNSRPPGQSTESCLPQAQPRLKPSFSEEERKGFEQRGFKDTFLSDSLNGLSDPLGGGSIGGGGLESNAGLTPLSPEQRGIQPSFDPTDVIIPRGGFEDKGGR